MQDKPWVYSSRGARGFRGRFLPVSNLGPILEASENKCLPK